jgi:superfamily II DNA or RNA helicase
MKTPFEHQLEVLEILKHKDKGKIILPTGTGKTWIEAWDLSRRIEENNKFGVYVVLSPRIMLSLQLLIENKFILLSKGIDAKYLCVHSGNVSEENEDIELLRLQKDIPYSQMISTTSPKEILRNVNLAKKENRPLIIFSTYHSSLRIVKGIGDNKINTVYCDESHYLVRDDFHMFLRKVKTNNIYFFTATEKHSDSEEGMGMNNESIYGELLYTMSPREAIDRGLMVRPRIHIIRSSTKDYHFSEDLDKSFSNVVFQSFRQHEYSLGNQNGKMLVVVRGTSDIKRFINSKECERLIRSGVDVFAVSSTDEIGNWINGKKNTREKFLKILKDTGLNPSKRMVVLHYDILTEGIDTTFTGFLPFKGLNKLKFTQTYGRVGRLDPEDRIRISKKEIQPNDINEFYKPYGWVIIPELLFEDVDNNRRIYNLVDELRDYGFNPVDDLVVSNINGGGIGVITGPEVLTDLKKRENNVGVFIESLEYSMEEERIASLSNEEFLDEFLN